MSLLKMDNARLSPDVAAKIRAYEVKQRKINAYQMPNCIGHYRKIAADNSNWELYHDMKWGGIVSIAKPESGASDACWACGLDEIRRRVLCGLIPWKNVTKYGRRVLGLYADEPERMRRAAAMERYLKNGRA